MFNILQFMDEKLIEYSVPLWLSGAIESKAKGRGEMHSIDQCKGGHATHPHHPPTSSEGVTAAVNLNEQLLLGH